MPIAQFPWRMLSVISLVLALFTGGLTVRMNQVRPALAVTIALVALIVWAHMPRLDAPDVFAPVSVDVSAPVAVQIEADAQLDEGALGNSLMHEYRPRWADRALRYAPALEDSAPGFDVSIQRANLLDMDLRVAGDIGGPLRFHTFYFPGWQVTMDGQALTPYPSTNLGLLTVDLPPGRHELSVRWADTRAQQVAAWLSMLALVGLTLVVWRGGRARWAVAVPLCLLAWGALGRVQTPPLHAVAAPPSAMHAHGLELRGLRTEMVENGRLHVYPFWLTTAIPPPDLVVHWTLLRDGQLIATYAAQPIFNAVSPRDWPPGTLVDDAYRLPLPSRLAPGTYDLALALATADGPLPPAQVVTQVTLARAVVTGELPPPDHMVDARFGQAARLVGYSLAVRHARADALPDGTPVVPAGAYLEYALQWQANARMDENYHTFVHLVDHLGRPIAQEDHLPGPSFRPPALWSDQQREPDVYLLRVPATTLGGLYWPAAGMYAFRNQDRLDILTGDGATTDALRLGPVKVVGTSRARPEVELTARFGEMAHLRGYTITPASTTVNAGDAVTVTLVFQADGTGHEDVTRFLQLYDPALGMAAQADGIPAHGVNPTWSWVESETVTDEVLLTIAPDAAPGVYTLYTGFYNPADGVRMPVFDDQGMPLPDNWLPITQLTVR